MSTPFPALEDMTVRMVREYLARKQSIIVPFGCIEQHGDHLPLRTDALIGTEVALRVGRETDTLVAPVVHQTFSGGGCPGTINISPAVMSLLVNDLLISLVRQGFRVFFLLVAHGGSENFRALQDGLRLLLRNNPAFAEVLIALLPLWTCDADGNATTQAFRDHDWHAGWLETSLMLALAPALVRLEDLRTDTPELLRHLREHPDHYQCAAKIVDDPAVVPRLEQRPDVQVGVMGYPERASAEAGRAALASLVRGAAAKVRSIEAGYDGVYRPVRFTPEPLVF